MAPFPIRAAWVARLQGGLAGHTGAIAGPLLLLLVLLLISEILVTLLAAELLSALPGVQLVVFIAIEPLNEGFLSVEGFGTLRNFVLSHLTLMILLQLPLELSL